MVNIVLSIFYNVIQFEFWHENLISDFYIPMQNISKLEHIREYSDDEIVYDPPNENELDEMEAYDSSYDKYEYGSPNDGVYINLGNPERRNNAEALNYSIDYYYREKGNIETFHIFRTIKPNKNEKSEHEYFPSTEYIKRIQKLQGSSLIKIVEFSEREKWIHFEYVPGGTLYDSLKYGRQFNIVDEFKILNGIAITMNFLHEREITHLDIRLESIVVTAAENKPVIADIDMMINLFKTRDDYEDKFLPYLNPNFKSSEVQADSVLADIYSYGIMMNLFIQKNTKVLEDENIPKIKKAYEEFIKSNMKEEDKIKKYLDAIGINLIKDTSEEPEKELMQISWECISGQIKSTSDLLNKLKSAVQEGSYISATSNDLNKDFILIDEDSQNRDYNSNNKDKEFDFNRSNLSTVERSASSLNAKDIWLINKRDQIKKRLIQQRAAEASLYATITNDFSLYESILREESVVIKTT